jgi:hypothetical protein
MMTKPESSAATKLDPIRNALAHAIRAWSRSDVLCESPSQDGEPEGAAVSESLAARPEQFESLLLPLLNHPDTLVAAYALLTLHRMHSSHLAALPSAVFARLDSLRVRRGCFTATTDFASFAHRITNDRNA